MYIVCSKVSTSQWKINTEKQQYCFRTMKFLLFSSYWDSVLKEIIKYQEYLWVAPVVIYFLPYILNYSENSFLKLLNSMFMSFLALFSRWLRVQLNSEQTILESRFQEFIMWARLKDTRTHAHIHTLLYICTHVYVHIYACTQTHIIWHLWQHKVRCF